MRKLLALVAIAVSASVASAMDFTWPDFSLETQYEMDFIKADPAVKAYARRLGARSIRVTRGKPGRLMYAVKTNNGCTFDVKVVYHDWPGIDDVIVYDSAVCR